MNRLFTQLLQIRHLDDQFLHPRYDDLTDPLVFLDMDKAVARIGRAIDAGEKILIFGDYDVDGVTAAALMAEALKLAGAAPPNLDIMLPDRFLDGYGMSPRLIERAKAGKASLVITVDCGSRNPEIIDQLQAAGIDTIVTDHHECDAQVPPHAVAVLNPKRHDFPEQFAFLRDLAGVGVAFKLAQALVAKGRIRSGQEKWLLDLVLLGTVCDQMPLTGENRILGFYGVKVLGKTRRIGLKELMRTAKITSLTADSIGFQLGPRLNAAGRLDSADLALRLLLSQTRPEAAALAERLEQLNLERKTAQQAAVREITARKLAPAPVIVETGAWHEGILGIVAGRLVEQYQRPAFVLSEVEPGVLKGSGRSFGEFSLAAALEAAQDTIIGGGGHAAAAGVRLATKNLGAFTQRINDYYRSLHLVDQTRFLREHEDLAVADFSDFSLELLDSLALLEPFGTGNSQPLFRLRGAKVVSATRLGAEKNHLRLEVADPKGHRFKLLAFSAPEPWLALSPDDHIEPLIRLERNEFRGVVSPEGRLVDLSVPG